MNPSSSERRKPCGFIPGVGDDAAPADSHGLAVVSISIGATSEGCVWSLIVSQAITYKVGVYLGFE